MDHPQVSIRVDRRERGKIIQRLEDIGGVTLEVADLEFGDYILPHEVAIERKSATDFILSVVDGGLWTNIEGLKCHFRRILYLIEGDPYVARFHQKALDVHRAFARMVMVHNITILPSADADNSAMMIYLLALTAQEQPPQA